MDMTPNSGSSHIPSPSRQSGTKPLPTESDQRLTTDAVSNGQKNPAATVAKTNISLLSVFTIMYLIPTVLVSEIVIGIWSWGIAALVALVGIATTIRARPPRKPTECQLQGVGLTSMLEFVAVLVGLGIGFVTDSWVWFGVLLLGSVLLHFIFLGLAYRRAVDIVAIVGVAGALLIAMTDPLGELLDSWAIAGGLSAGCTIAYIVAMARSLPELTSQHETRTKSPSTF